jgi:hypothetical protein
VLSANCSTSSEPIPLASLPLDTCLGPDHGHDLPGHNAWVNTYDEGAMDGACTSPYAQPTGCPLPSNMKPQLTYVDNATYNLVQPYFDIARRWGFANYMFQTNQGPSFEAHQFLFGGTSAPDMYNDTNQNCGAAEPCWQWFAAENQMAQDERFGCPGIYQGTYDSIYEIAPTGAESAGYAPPLSPAGYPCYDHYTMADLLDQNGITWDYYPQGPSSGASLWTAPNAISAICPLDANNNCTGTYWMSHVGVHIPPYPPEAGAMAPILTDIASCSLPQVSWVIPDGWWSDHPGGCANSGCACNSGLENCHVMGPAWVTDIVNAVGSSTTCDNDKGYWNNTVILITWDDWGGWYDHISPSHTGAPGIGYSNQTGKQYVYGFRVPLLVVSTFAKYGYISGACGQSGQPGCPNLQVPYVHDFGSILNFIEWAFGTNNEFLHFPDQPSGSGISPDYHYADVLAPDQPNAPLCSPQTCPYGLSDFFNFNNPHTFGQPIPLPYVLRNCTATWFENFGTTTLCTSTAPGTGSAYPAPADPDDDAVTSAAPTVP